MFFGAAFAAATETPEMDRPVAITGNKVKIWARYDLFTEGMDLLNYRSRFHSSTVLKQFDQWKFGINHAPFATGAWRAVLFGSQQKLSRTLQPTQINSHYRGFSLAWQQTLLKARRTRTVLEFGIGRQRSPNTFFDRYNTSPNVEIIAAPGRHLVNISAWSKEWRLALRQGWQASPAWLFHGDLNYRQLRIESHMDSYDPLVRASLRSPQNEPWQEQHIGFNIDGEWHFSSAWQVSMGWQHIQIRRKNYRQISGNLDYNTQDIINTHLYYHINRRLTAYWRAQANTRFLLGDAPLAYNSRTSARFHAPFGFLSFGLTFSL
ncbi:MAG: hypothetical protein Q9M22_05105 [Mariprofundaceae bacterium]|nr:hypothetical protein [Mariprofundaceae bacterium]